MISPSANADEITTGVTFLRWLQNKSVTID